MSRELRFRAATARSTGPYGRRCVLWPRAYACLDGPRMASRKWVRAEQHGTLIPAIPPAALLPRELRQEWSLMLSVEEKERLLSFTLFLSPSCTRYVYFIFERGNRRPRVIFLEQWSNIWCRGNGNIFNNRYERARVTIVVVRTCGLFCPTWIMR